MTKKDKHIGCFPTKELATKAWEEFNKTLPGE